MALIKLNNQSLTAVTSAGLPTGSVLQVKQKVQTGNQLPTAANTFENITGLTLDITPIATTSKILVQWSVNFYAPSTYGVAIVPIRDGTTRFYYDNASRPYEFYVGAGGLHGRVTNQYLDSPATTSSTTYQMQSIFSLYAVSSGAQIGSDSFPMTLTLMEIAG